MKKQTGLFCLFSLLWAPLFAQDWSLLTVGSKCNFQSSTAGYVTNTIRVDSAAALGNDSVFWLSQPRGLYTSGYPYIVMIGNLLGDSLVKHPGFVYECRFRLPIWPEYEQESYFIHAKAQPDDSWQFKTGVTASVTEIKDTICWGVADSIKTISLSDGKVLRLSKQFGLFFFENQTLVGLQGQDVGTQLPVLADFYSDWVNGAVFEKYDVLNENYGASTNRTWTKFYVQGKVVTPDSIKISVRKLSRRETWFFSNPGPVTFGDEQKVLVFPNPKKVYYPGLERPAMYSDFTSTYYEPTAQGLQVSITSSTPPGYGGPIRRNIFIAGIGETEMEFTYGYSGFSSSHTENLSGYKKVGQNLYGTIHPDSFFGVTTVLSDLDGLEQLMVYPNPVSDFLYVQCDQCPQPVKAEWINTAGQAVWTGPVNAPDNSLRTSDLQNGFYLLRLSFENGACVVRKVLVR